MSKEYCPLCQSEQEVTGLPNLTCQCNKCDYVMNCKHYPPEPENEWFGAILGGTFFCRECGKPNPMGRVCDHKEDPPPPVRPATPEDLARLGVDPFNGSDEDRLACVAHELARGGDISKPPYQFLTTEEKRQWIPKRLEEPEAKGWKEFLAEQLIHDLKWVDYLDDDSQITTPVTKANGFEYEVSRDRFGQNYLTVRMPTGFTFSMRVRGDVDEAKHMALRYHQTVAPVRDWISVDDQLPPRNMNVLLMDRSIGIVVGMLVYRSETETYWETYGGHTFTGPIGVNKNNPVTHWMFLPSKPEEAF